MNTHYTIESLISELTSIATARGWGLQSTTNIWEIQSTSGDREVKLLHGDEQDTEVLKDRVSDLESEVRTLNNDLDDITTERDALMNRVEGLVGEVLTLKEAARDMTA